MLPFFLFWIFYNIFGSFDFESKYEKQFITLKPIKFGINEHFNISPKKVFRKLTFYSLAVLALSIQSKIR